MIMRDLLMSDPGDGHYDCERPMHKVILELPLAPQETTVKAVRDKLALHSNQIDRKFGVRPVRPAERVYAVRVDADVAERVRGEDRRGGASAPADDVQIALVH
jgi:hypothetical protein